MPALDELVTEFRRTYAYTEPYLVKGLGEWRLTNIAPSVPDDYYGIFAVLPMTADNDVDTETATVGFTIWKLPEVFDVTGNISSWLLPERRTVRSIQFRRRARVMPQLPNITATLPIKAYSNTKGVAVTFNIAELPQAEVYGKRTIGVTVKNPYNRTSNVNVAATPPIYTINEAGAVDLSFDITLLSDA